MGIKTTGGVSCKFPFTYNEKAYTECTKTGHTQLWCLTPSHWGNCQGKK